MDIQQFGEKFKTLRKAANVTQTQLSVALGVHLQTVSKWERGVSLPDISQLGDIAEVFGVTLEQLLDMPQTDKTYVGSFNAESLGNRVASKRKAIGLSQEQLAERVNVSADAVSRWERGISCPAVDELCVLSYLFECSVSELYYAVTEIECQVEPIRVIPIKKRKFTWTALVACLLAVCLVASAIVIAVWQGEVDKYCTVKVGDKTYSVVKNSFFTPADPQVKGYRVAAWKDKNGNAVTFPQAISKNCSYSPVFEPIEYTIDYWLTGGAFSERATFTFTVEDQEIIIPDAVRDGVEFLGWYLSPDFQGERVKVLPIEAANVALYARWQDGACEVRYEPCGGTIVGNNPSLVNADSETELISPSRSGYDFLGWFDSPSGGTRYTSVGGKNCRNMTLYACWQENASVISVEYDLCGGEAEKANSTQILGSAAPVKLYGATKRGYDFVGWNDRIDGGGKFYATLADITENVKLYAIFKPKTFTIIYYGVGEGYYPEGIANPNQIKYTDVVYLKPLVRTGYVFEGWFSASSGGQQIEKIDSSNVGNYTLYARFRRIAVTVTLDADGGTFADENGQTVERAVYSVYFGDFLDLPTPVRADYVFEGWENENDGKRVDRFSCYSDENARFVAKWRAAGKKYGIKYNLQGGTMPADNPSEFDPASPQLLKEATKDGCSFVGWYATPDTSGVRYWYTPSDVFADLELWAVWQAVGSLGNVDDFTYMTVDGEVTILGYSGHIGENVDVVIPSYINGLPVTKIECVLECSNRACNDPLYTAIQRAPLRSVTLPQGLKEIGENSFGYVRVEQPIVVPDSVQIIRRGAFGYCWLGLEIGQNSALNTIEEGSFNQCDLRSTLFVPKGVKSLSFQAFGNTKACGLILSEGLEYLKGVCNVNFSVIGSSQYLIYVPSTVRAVEKLDSSTMRVSSQNGFLSDSYPKASGQTVTLKDGDSTTVVSGEVLRLPVLQKGGYEFCGWYCPRAKSFVPQVLVDFGDCELEAVYRNSDGTRHNPIEIKDGESITLYVHGGQSIFLMANMLPNEYYTVTVSIDGFESQWTPFYAVFLAGEKYDFGALFGGVSGSVVELIGIPSAIAYRVTITFHKV